MTDHFISNKLKRQLKIWHNSVPIQQSLAGEMLEILSSYYFLQGISSESESDDPLDNMRRVKLIQLLISDIILRLCKFRDDSSMSVSFIQVYKALRKRTTTKGRVEGIELEIANYNRLTQNLENHRNSYIAHLSKRDRTHLKPAVEMFDAIVAAVQVIDTLCGGRNSYKLLDVDLRQAVIGEAAASTQMLGLPARPTA